MATPTFAVPGPDPDLTERLRTLGAELTAARARQREIASLLDATGVARTGWVDPVARRRAVLERDEIDRIVEELDLEVSELAQQQMAARETQVTDLLAVYVAADREHVVALDAALTKAAAIERRRRELAAQFEAATGRQVTEGAFSELNLSDLNCRLHTWRAWAQAARGLAVATPSEPASVTAARTALTRAQALRAELRGRVRNYLIWLSGDAVADVPVATGPQMAEARQQLDAAEAELAKVDAAVADLQRALDAAQMGTNETTA